MLTILGIAGGPNVLGGREHVPNLPPLFFHDAAAALVVGGEIRYAIEEERLSRIKHTNCFPKFAIRACLDEGGVEPNEIDRIAFFFDEEFCDVDFRRIAAELRITDLPRVRAMIAENIKVSLNFECPLDLITFCRHHDSHSYAAVHASGFGRALSVVIDGNGEREAATAYEVNQGEHRRLGSVPVAHSPGRFYRAATKLLGFGDFDEYKVMGLAPYGDAERFRDQVNEAYVQLEADGYGLAPSKLWQIAHNLSLPIRNNKSQLTRVHMDFAAAVQSLLERVVLDLLSRWQGTTGLRRLCLSGGVAQNCAMNGMIARSGLFDAVFVHPASHDAGAAIGAALAVNAAVEGKTTMRPFSPFIGRAIATGGSQEQLGVLKQWSSALAWEIPKDIHTIAAGAISDSKIVGWARNRSEFGPRALGARSILADPRPRENWTRINLAIKKRESFRPFAPAVLEEEAAKFFELPQTACNLGQMSFVVPVRSDWRSRLGAVTHIDGTARLQVVSKSENEDFWTLLDRFRLMSGMGVLLNTSFNNAYEPIVESPLDAVRTFLTTDLDLLVLGPYLVRKTQELSLVAIGANVHLVEGAEFLHRTDSNGAQTAWITRGSTSVGVSALLAKWLLLAGHSWSVCDALSAVDSTGHSKLLDEIIGLWEARVFELTLTDK